MSWNPAGSQSTIGTGDQYCQGSILGTIHLKNPVDGMDGGAGWTHSRFADDTELEEWFLPQMGELPLRGTLTICGNGPTET